MIKIVRVQKFATFQEMLRQVGWQKVAPRAGSLEEALKLCYQFYSSEEEKKYGVLAIHFKLLGGK